MNTSFISIYRCAWSILRHKYFQLLLNLFLRVDIHQVKMDSVKALEQVTHIGTHRKTVLVSKYFALQLCVASAVKCLLRRYGIPYSTTANTTVLMSL